MSHLLLADLVFFKHKLLGLFFNSDVKFSLVVLGLLISDDLSETLDLHAFLFYSAKIFGLSFAFLVCYKFSFSLSLLLDCVSSCQRVLILESKLDLFLSFSLLCYL